MVVLSSTTGGEDGEDLNHTTGVEELDHRRH
jgi:hypothetical protein